MSLRALQGVAILSGLSLKKCFWKGIPTSLMLLGMTWSLRLILVVGLLDKVINDRKGDQESDGVADDHPCQIELNVSIALVEDGYAYHDAEQDKRYDQRDEQLFFMAFLHRLPLFLFAFRLFTQFRCPFLKTY